MTTPWPYDLPIFRRAHRAIAPDGAVVAEIERAFEIGMSLPTSGTLTLSTGLQLDRCNPSFVWSDDSRYLAVPRYFQRFGIFRRQRVVVIDVVERKAVASPQMAYYFQPESFAGGVLSVTKEPFKTAARVTWRIPGDLHGFVPVEIGPPHSRRGEALPDAARSPRAVRDPERLEHRR
jgi:hypothetical protein